MIEQDTKDFFFRFSKKSPRHLVEKHLAETIVFWSTKLWPYCRGQQLIGLPCLSNSGICFDLNYSVINEMKQKE